MMEIDWDEIAKSGKLQVGEIKDRPLFVDGDTRMLKAYNKQLEKAVFTLARVVQSLANSIESGKHAERIRDIIDQI